MLLNFSFARVSKYLKTTLQIRDSTFPTATRMKKNESEKGQGLTEYAILVSLVALACMAGMALFGNALQGRIASVVAALGGLRNDEVIKGEEKAKGAAVEVIRKLTTKDGMRTTADELLDDNGFPAGGGN